MVNFSPDPWTLVSVPLDVSLTLDVLGQPIWQRPIRARIAEDPCDGPPTQIRRSGGTLARRRIGLQLWFDADDADLDGTLDDFWAAFNAIGPYSLTDHRGETVTAMFNLAVEPTVADQGVGLTVSVAVLEV